MARVLQVTQAVGDVSATVGGVAVVLLDDVAALVQGGHDVTVAGPDRGNLAADVADRGARYVQWEATRDPGPTVGRETRALRSIIAAVDPQVVHLHSSKAGLAGRLALRGKRPTIFSPHAWSFHHGGNKWVGRAALAWERFATRWTDVILCVGDAERDEGRAVGIDGRYEVLANTIDLPDPGLDQAAARALVVPAVADGTPIALCIGRLTRQKGQDILLAAWPQVRHTVPDAQLLIVGSGPDAAELQRHVVPGVTFVPAVPRSQVPQWNLAADVVVFPSRWEGFSLGVLEALQLGRPVVVSDCQGMAESLAGGRGQLVPVGDVAALAGAVSRYLGDREFAATEGAAAAEAFVAVHGVRRRENAARYRALIEELAR